MVVHSLYQLVKLGGNTLIELVLPDTGFRELLWTENVPDNQCKSNSIIKKYKRFLNYTTNS